MDIQSVSAAASIAIACAIVFLLAAKSWQLLTRLLSGHPSFADSIMSEAAQRFRDELRVLSRDQATWLGAALVFVVMYVAATAFEGPKIFVGYPEWQLYVFLTALTAAALFALYRLIRTVVAWRQVRFVRDANIAVGHQLQRIAAGHGRAYHDVPTSAGVIDHVLIGQNGVYAINVVAKRHFKSADVVLDGNELRLGTQRKPISIVAMAAANRRLAKEFSRLTGHDIRVRSVIAVPGWDIQNQTSAEHLLVNERSLPMLRGWKDQADYLMNEDVDELMQYLTERCSRSA